MKGSVYNKKVTNGDIGRKGSKIWHFLGDAIFQWPLGLLLKLNKYFFTGKYEKREIYETKKAKTNSNKPTQKIFLP